MLDGHFVPREFTPVSAVLDQDLPTKKRSAATNVRAAVWRLAVAVVHRAFDVGVWLGVLLCVVAVVLRLTIRDSVPAFAPVFYATPLALVAGGLIFGSICFRAKQRRGAARFTLMLGAACIVWWWQTGCYARAVAVPRQHLRVLLWNLARGDAGWNAVGDAVKAREAPLIGLVEAGGDSPARRRYWKQRFPDHQAVFCGHQMVLLVAGEVLHEHAGSFDGNGWFGRVDVRIQGQEFTVVIVDVHSNPMRNRMKPMQGLAELCKTYCHGPTIIMGDFNTPPESAAFDVLRERHRNAFEQAGSGLAATWPVPCPVLGLDQIWTNEQVRVHRVDHGWSSVSDHRPVAAAVSFVGPSEHNR